jgi:hypothetical protein
MSKVILSFRWEPNRGLTYQPGWKEDWRPLELRKEQWKPEVYEFLKLLATTNNPSIRVQVRL